MLGLLDEWRLPCIAESGACLITDAQSAPALHRCVAHPRAHLCGLQLLPLGPHRPPHGAAQLAVPVS